MRYHDTKLIHPNLLNVNIFRKTSSFILTNLYMKKFKVPRILKLLDSFHTIP